MTDRQLAVDAELVVERDGRTFGVWDDGDTLVVNAPSLSALRALDDLRTAVPFDALEPGENLASAGLTVDVQVRRATVARFGAGVEGTSLGRRLTGVDAAVDWRGVATAVVRALG